MALNVNGKTMAPHESEKHLQNRIIEFLNVATKGLFWQNDAIGVRGRKRENRYRPNGVPDVLGVIDGQFVGIEVKTKNGKLLPSQIEFSARFIEAGGLYYVTRSLTDLVEICKVSRWLKCESVS